jgi:hypothetical protein
MKAGDVHETRSAHEHRWHAHHHLDAPWLLGGAGLLKDGEAAAACRSGDGHSHCPDNNGSDGHSAKPARRCWLVGRYSINCRSMSLPKSCLAESSESKICIDHCKSYNSLDKTETLHRRSKIAWYVSLSIAINIFGIQASLSLGVIIDLLYLSIFSLMT